MRSNFIDETGNRYGSLTVIEPAKDKNNKSAWKCLCDCGNYKIVRGPDLRKGKITSCGCRRFAASKRSHDLTGQIFGFLTVIERDYSENKNQKAYWKCKCSCGQFCSRNTSDLINGKVRSCGCKSNELKAQAKIKNEIGNRYGKLKVIDMLKDPRDNKIKCYCQCDCGNRVYVPGTYLRDGNTRSCGCNKLCNTSSGSLTIKGFLENNKIKFLKEYTFKDLLSERGHKLRFDFAVFDSNNNLKLLIEYDGPQHKKPVNIYGGKQQFDILQQNDKLKNDYCEKNNIPLFRIDYNKQNSVIEKEVECICKKMGII